MPRFLNSYGTENQCEKALHIMRWPQGLVCPNCGGAKHYKLKTRKLYQCSACKRQILRSRRSRRSGDTLLNYARKLSARKGYLNFVKEGISIPPKIRWHLFRTRTYYLLAKDHNNSFSIQLIEPITHANVSLPSHTIITIPVQPASAADLDFGTLKATPTMVVSITLAEGAVVPVPFGESIQLVAKTYPEG